jgi:hypothetical protein
VSQFRRATVRSPVTGAVELRAVVAAGPRILRFWKREVVRRKGETSEGFERTTLLDVGERFAGEEYRRRSPLPVSASSAEEDRDPGSVSRSPGTRPRSGTRPPRPLLHVGAARRRGRVRPYLNLYAHPGLMYELYTGPTLGRSEA